MIFVICMTVLTMGYLLKSHFCNQEIYLFGGKYAGDYQGSMYGLLDDLEEEGTTVVQWQIPVANSLSTVYIRLYQLCTGKCYEACMNGLLQIGRGENNTETPKLIIDDSMVSKKHCVFYKCGDQLMIQDLGSKNHTFVNGCMITGAVPIAHGDQLTLGKNVYQFQCYYSG